MPTNIRNEGLEELTPTDKMVVPHTAVDGKGRLLVVVSANNAGSGSFTYTASRPSCNNATSTEVLAASATTKYARLTNNTNFPFYLAFGATAAVAGQGVVLDPGAALEFFTEQAINAIQSSGGSLTLDVLKGT